MKDGILYIDAAEHNVITGMAIVSVPAYEESFALSLVAEERTEVDNSDEEVNEGVENMDKANEIVTEQAPAEEVVAISEETKPEETTEQATAQAEEQTAEAEAQTETQEATAQEEDEENTDEEAEKPEETEDDKPSNEEEEATAEADEDKKEGCSVAELEIALAKTEADWAAEHAQYMALEAEIADLRAFKAQADAEIERLRAIEAELAAINAAKEAEELANKQEIACRFAQKQGLDIADEAVASAVKSLDYQAIAELAMEKEPAEQTPVVTVAGFAVTNPMKIKNRFENVLKRVSE